MTSQTFFLIFIPILATILIIVYLIYASRLSAFFKAKAYKFCILATCFFSLSLPMKIFLTSLGMQSLIPVWAGFYACLLIIVAACSNGRNLPKALMFVTAFSIATIIGYIFMLILPELLSSIKQLAIILPSLALFGYFGYSPMPMGAYTSNDSVDIGKLKINKADSAGEGPSNSSGKRKAQSPLSSKAIKPFLQEESSGSDLENARSKLPDAKVEFFNDGRIIMGNIDLSGNPNLQRVRKYKSPIDLSSNETAASNNISIESVEALSKAKEEMNHLQKVIHRDVLELIKQQYRIGKSVRQPMGISHSGQHVAEASSFDSTIKINSELTQDRFDRIFELAEKKYNLSKAIHFSAYSGASKNRGILSKPDLKDISNVSAFLAVHNDTFK